MNLMEDRFKVETRGKHKHLPQLEQISQLILEVEREENLDYSVAKKVAENLNIFFDKVGLKGITAKHYGSYSSQLALRASNINIELRTDGISRNHVLEEIYKHLSREFYDCCVTHEEKNNAHHKSKVCFIDQSSGITCEIMRSGRRTSQNFSHLLKALCKYDTRVRPLLIAIRRWAEICEIHEVENGRLHPLCYILLVIHFLQQRNPPILPIVDPCKRELDKLEPCDASIGELWLELLHYYSQFDWKEDWISITKIDANLKPYDCKSYQQVHKRPGGFALMTIEDPFIPERNMAETVRNEKVRNFIQKCFHTTYEYFSHIPTESSDDDSGNDTSNSDSESCKYSFCVFYFVPEMEIPEPCFVCEDLDPNCKECNEEVPVVKLTPLPEMRSYFLNVIEKSLEEVYEKYQLRDHQVKGRLAFVEDMEKCVRERFRGAKLELIGSSMNGFGFIDSDLDICMTLLGVNEKNVNVIQVLRSLCSHLRKKNYSALVLYSAKIPIIKFSHRNPNFQGDISLYNVLAVYNTKLLNTYSLIDKRVRILGCAMKVLAKNGDIADSANFTLSSYSYILLVIHFLQQTEPPILPVLQEIYDKRKRMPEIIVSGCNVWFFKDLTQLDKFWNRKPNKATAAALWVEFLEYYARKLNEETFVVSVRKKELLDEEQHKLKKMSRLLNIEDPFLLFKNLGRVVSEKTAVTTQETLLRARSLFGTPRTERPIQFKDWTDFFFDPGNLTGRIIYPSSKDNIKSPEASSNSVFPSKNVRSPLQHKMNPRFNKQTCPQTTFVRQNLYSYNRN